MQIQTAHVALIALLYITVNNTLLILASKSSLIPAQPLELSQHSVTSAFIYRVQIIQIQSAQLLLISKVLKQNIKNWRVAQDLCTALDMRFRRIDKRVSLNTGIFDSSKLVDNTVVNTLLSQLFQCFFFLLLAWNYSRIKMCIQWFTVLFTNLSRFLVPR